LFPGEEDYGIVPVEANACGTPVLALAKGGAIETIIPLGQARPTGVWFTEQTVEAVIGAIEQFERERSTFDPVEARQQAEKFDQQRYETDLWNYLEKVWNGG